LLGEAERAHAVDAEIERGDADPQRVGRDGPSNRVVVGREDFGFGADRAAVQHAFAKVLARAGASFDDVKVNRLVGPPTGQAELAHFVTDSGAPRSRVREKIGVHLRKREVAERIVGMPPKRRACCGNL